MKVSEFLGKRVLDKDALEIGKISDMEINPIDGVITSVTISKSELSFRQQAFIVTIDQLDKVGDYVIIKETGENLESQLESQQKEESEEESESISISIENPDQK
jgi:sporulation protein YlmC with PRC-barrel domain